MIPHRAGLPPATVIYASGYAVPLSARHKRLSVQLAAFMTDSLAQVTRAAGGLEIRKILTIDPDTYGIQVDLALVAAGEAAAASLNLT